MTKYKLIKEYPGSPKLGITLRYTGNDWDDQNQLRVSLVESTTFLDYWEKVVEKDYEILSFIGSNTTKPLRILNEYTKLYKHATVNDTDELTEEYLLSGVGYNIHSIKRLSDGEIFTIGNILTDALCGNSPLLYFTNNIDEGFLLHTKYGAGPLSRQQKAKQPLFTTEDDVDIFEGDTFWRVSKDCKDNYDSLPVTKNYQYQKYNMVIE